MIRTRKSTLENGIRVVTEHVPAARSVAIGVLVSAGPYEEPSSMPGIAHLTEHMVFQGTSSRSAQDISELMDGAGGQMGGFTSRDYTVYFAHVLDDYATYAVDLLGDVLLNPTFPEVALEREKQIVLCELEGSDDNPRHRVDELLRSGLWGTHPLGRPLAGSAEVIQDLKREDLIYFFHRNYVPERLIIAAAGNVCHDDFVAQIRDAFWRMLGSADEPSRPVPQLGSGIHAERRAVSQAYFALGFPAPEFDHPMRYSVLVLNHVLGSGMSSRSFLRLREQLGIAYDVHSSYLAYGQSGLWSLSCATRPDDLASAIGAVRQLLGEITSGAAPVTPEELAKTRRQLTANVLLATEDTHSRMNQLAVQEHYFGRRVPETELVHALERVGIDDLTEAAREVFGDLDRATTAIVGPLASWESMGAEFGHPTVGESAAILHEYAGA